MRLISLILLLALTGCEYSAVAVAKKQQYSDEESRVFRHAPCAMTVGSYWRNLNAAERQAVDVLCGGGPAIPTLNAETGLLEEN